MSFFIKFLGPRILSAFWVVMFYFTMIVFGLSQQMAIVHTVASGLISIRPDHFLQFESSLTFMSCLLGLVFSFPMATEVNHYIIKAFKIYLGTTYFIIRQCLMNQIFFFSLGSSSCTFLTTQLAVDGG